MGSSIACFTKVDNFGGDPVSLPLNMCEGIVTRTQIVQVIYYVFSATMVKLFLVAVVKTMCGLTTIFVTCHPNIDTSYDVNLLRSRNPTSPIEIVEIMIPAQIVAVLECFQHEHGEDVRVVIWKELLCGTIFARPSLFYMAF